LKVSIVSGLYRTVSDLIGRRVEIAAEWRLNRQTEDYRRQTLVSGRQVVELSVEVKNELLRIFERVSDSFIVKDLTPKFLKVGTFTIATPVEVLALGKAFWVT